eukprot:Gb_16918 [translate_table: standard]
MSDNARTQVASPCAACKLLRRRCAEKCVLAPYFPPDNPHKFATAHRVFGASNIIKILQDLPPEQRADAVSSMVYEATARLRDPVYGCAGAICQLQQQVSRLQSQLATTQADLLNMRLQQANLLSFISSQSPGTSGSSEGEPFSPTDSGSQENDEQHNNSLYDDVDPLELWGPLWT